MWHYYLRFSQRRPFCQKLPCATGAVPQSRTGTFLQPQDQDQGETPQDHGTRTCTGLPVPLLLAHKSKSNYLCLATCRQAIKSLPRIHPPYVSFCVAAHGLHSKGAFFAVEVYRVFFFEKRTERIPLTGKQVKTSLGVWKVRAQILVESMAHENRLQRLLIQPSFVSSM